MKEIDTKVIFDAKFSTLFDIFLQLQIDFVFQVTAKKSNRVSDQFLDGFIDIKLIEEQISRRYIYKAHLHQRFS